MKVHSFKDFLRTPKVWWGFFSFILGFEQLSAVLPATAILETHGPYKHQRLRHNNSFGLLELMPPTNNFPMDRS